MAPKSPKEKRRQKRNANRKALRKARNEAYVQGQPAPDIDPSEAMQHVLDRAFHMLRNTESAVGTLKPDELWRDTMAGRIPNEWIRLEEDLRKEVAQIAARMIDLDLEGRRTAVVEVLAATLVPVFDRMLKDLGLSKAQKAKAPKVIKAALLELEAG